MRDVSRDAVPVGCNRQEGVCGVCERISLSGQWSLRLLLTTTWQLAATSQPATRGARSLLTKT